MTSDPHLPKPARKIPISYDFEKIYLWQMFSLLIALIVMRISMEASLDLKYDGDRCGVPRGHTAKT